MLKKVQHDGWFAAVCALVILLCAQPVVAQTFPQLTGRVVDNARILSPAQVATLDGKLASVEQTTGRQLVVATVPDLQGYDIADYGYQLGRAWGIGKQGVDDGAILLVAPTERRVRIEVGYGLEPVLTDAYASIVISQTILPRFKANDYPGGIDAGVDAIAQQMMLTPEEAAKRTAALGTQTDRTSKGVNPATFIFWIVIFLFFILPMLRGMGGRRHRRGGSGIGNVILWSAINAAANSRSSGWGGGGGSGWGGGGGGGGFSGGGGSFGGGGASGGW